MANIKDIYLPKETTLTVTCDAVTTATIWQIGADGKPTGSLTSVAASASGTVGPFSAGRKYRITSSGGDATITQTAEAFIQSGGVAVSDLANGTDGELITWDASGNAATVAVGTSGHVLTSNGAGAAPTFQSAAAGGATTLITSTTASAASAVNFTDLSSSYHAYMVVFSEVVASADGKNLAMRVSTDNGSTFLSTATYYGAHTGRNSGSGALATSWTGDTQHILGGTLGNDTGENANGAIILYDPSDTTMPNHFSLEMSYIDNAGLYSYISGGGGQSGTSAVDAIQIKMYDGTTFSGEFRLYGITNA